MATKRKNIELLELKDAIAYAGGISYDEAIADGFDIPSRNKTKKLFNNGKNARSFDAMAEYLSQYGFNFGQLPAINLLNVLSDSYHNNIAFYTPAGWENFISKKHSSSDDSDYNDSPLNSEEITAIETAEKSFLSDYTESDLKEIEQAEKTAIAAEKTAILTATNKKFADSQCDTLADEMLGNIGTMDLMDIVKPMGVKKPEQKQVKPVKPGIKTMTKQEAAYYIKALMYMKKWQKARHYAKQLLNQDLSKKQRLVILQMLDYCNNKIMAGKAKKTAIARPDQTVSTVINASSIALKSTESIVNRIKKSSLYHALQTVDYAADVAWQVIVMIIGLK